MKPISWPRAIWNYLVYLHKHRTAVLIECWLLGIPLRGLVHDWHKFLPDEFFPYLWSFYATKIDPNVGVAQRLAIGNKRSSKADVDAQFDRAWLNHQRRSDHHWQSWLLVQDDGGLIKPLEMPIGAAKEMLADWLSFSRVFGTSTWDWYWERRDDIKLAPRTRVYVESMLRRIAKERGWK
jgi:hypothetical protein